MPSCIQPWVNDLTVMQQTVLLTAIRGPDGIAKDHPVKNMCRWFRRSILMSAFDGLVLDSPADAKGHEKGGSFTGPSFTYPADWEGAHFPTSLPNGEPWWWREMQDIASQYIRATDELPHHFQVHLSNASEILGYKHPNEQIRAFWNSFYRRLCDDRHMNPETEEQLDFRLSDNKENWIKAGDRASCGREDCEEAA